MSKMSEFCGKLLQRQFKCYLQKEKKMYYYIKKNLRIAIKVNLYNNFLQMSNIYKIAKKPLKCYRHAERQLVQNRDSVILSPSGYIR